ncbi:SMI1 / KNR4 family (SUKH-1) [Terribacillus saccharophilus]|uniref:SMI1 / KNR4 family (SUKH-1) n=1 Tax=Terribacillus saccharophilus TaxID=361277 RepID=A0AAX2EH06_9BACI|nr:SMI1 / KNR4 family (SUKH-1) [Terribacillus saccharophilus]
MTKDEIARILSNILDKESENLDNPSSNDWSKLESKFSCSFPKEFVYFIELMSDYSFPGEILNVSSGNTNGNDTIEFTYDYERNQGDLEEDLIPFYSIGNGDYFCLVSKECPNSGVYYYSHEESVIEKDADNFEDWIKQLPGFLS